MKYANSFKSFNESRGTGESHWYYGIADCNGLESFIKEPSLARSQNLDRLHGLGLSDVSGKDDPDKKAFGGNLNMMIMRCRFNDQRHPVVYRVKLSEAAAGMVDDMLTDGDYEGALRFIKDTAEEVQLARGGTGNAEKRWKNIPNRDLDPYS